MTSVTMFMDENAFTRSKRKIVASRVDISSILAYHHLRWKSVSPAGLGINTKDNNNLTLKASS